MQRLFGLDDDTLPAEYAALMSHFHKLLAEHAAILLIDSLDHLTDDNLACSRLSFLDNVRPHASMDLLLRLRHASEGEKPRGVSRAY